MNQVLKSIVLGEEYFKQITYDVIKKELRLNITHIMRSGPNNCEWGFDEALGIDDGILAFTGVKEIYFDSNGVLLEDIDDIIIEDLNNGLHKITFRCCGYEDGKTDSQLADLIIVAKDVYLIDTQNPDIIITE